MFEFSNLFLYISLFVSLFFEVFLLILWLEVKEEIKLEATQAKGSVENLPTVSIIVPCFNEEATVKATVKSLLALDYPSDRLSLLLVDDGSTDSTWEVLKKFESHPQIRIFKKENGGKHTALNFALEKIDSDLVGCLDADSFVSPDALKRIVPYFQDQSIMAVTPSVQVHEPKNILQYAQKIEYSWGVLLRRLLSQIGALYVTPGPFSIFRVRVFRDLGGYRHAHQTEDMEIAMRMQKAGYKIANSVGAHVYTVTPRKLKALYRQRVRWSYGFLNNAFDYRDMFFNTKYGHIGIFILPIAAFSIFSTVFAAGNVLVSMGLRASDAVEKYQAVGLTIKAPSLAFDWFFLDTGVTSILAMSAITLSFVLIGLSIRLSEGRFKLTKEFVYYLPIYMFIVPLWYAGALFNTVFRRTVTWR